MKRKARGRARGRGKGSMRGDLKRASVARRSEWLWMASLGTCSAAVTVHPVHESDPFWQMTLGRAVLASGARTFPEPVAFSEFTNPAVVPEWLWAVSTYVLHQLWGWPALAFLLGFAAMAAALAVWKLARAYAGDAPTAAIALVALLGLVLVSSRMRLRPQAAFMVLLPLFVLFAHRYEQASERARIRAGVALVALEVLWAQLHGSFVLGPAILGLVIAPRLWAERTQAAWRCHAVVLLGVTAALFTSAHGLETIGYVLAHSGGDAALHMQDMRPPSWASLDPTASPYAAAYLSLWALALAGAITDRRIDLGGLGLALLGVALLATASRFFAAAGLLAIPLAARGVSALSAAYARRTVRLPAFVAVCTAAGLFVWAGWITGHLYGPLGRTGLAIHAHPRAATAFLANAPDGARVLSSMSASGPLGYWLEGHVRTYLDARTPLYFDDTDFGVARELFAHADALERGIAHFEPWAVVVERDTTACRSMEDLDDEGWVPVVIEARFTTFIPSDRAGESGALALEALAPCGAAYLAANACREDGTAFGRDLVRLTSLADGAFAAYLAAEHALGCRGEPEIAARLLPPRDEAFSFEQAHVNLAGRLALARGDFPRALALLGPRARAGDVQALNALGAAMPARTGAPAFRGVLEDAMSAWGDTAPPELRSNLALLCTTLEDAECARFHGLRAAARGMHRVVPVLQWLTENHPDERTRRDATRWIETLTMHDTTRVAQTQRR